MKKSVLFLFLLVFWTVSASAAVNLMVTNTDPVNGSSNVSPSTGEIRIFFSHPVKMNSWSLVDTGAGPLPEILGPPRFESNTVCVIPVRLKPGTEYYLGVNSETRTGFKLAADETITCHPYVLAFTTSSETAQPQPTPPRTSGTDAPPTTMSPGWGTQSPQPAQPTQPVQPSPQVQPGQPMPQPQPLPQTDQSSITGIWGYRDAQEEIILNLMSNGAYDLRTRSAEGMETTRGVYSFRQGYITATPEGEPTLTVKAHLLNPNALEIWFPKDDGGTLQIWFQRLSAIPSLSEWSPQGQPQPSQQPYQQQPYQQQPYQQQPYQQQPYQQQPYQQQPYQQQPIPLQPMPPENYPKPFHPKNSPPQQDYPQPRYQQQNDRQPQNPNQGSGAPRTVLFRKYTDRTENAFSVLIPNGWTTAGGMLRVDPTRAGGPTQSIEAKLDFAVASDAQGTVMIRWLPHIYYTGLTGSPAAQMGLFPPGSNYMGMTVMPLMAPQDFAARIAFPYLRPQAQGVQVVEQRLLPDLSASLQRSADQGPMAFLGIQYSAGLLTVDYQEGGRTFREKILVIIEDRGRNFQGQWTNRFTVAVRAPRDEFPSWEPIWFTIHNSSVLSPQWVAGEVRGQIERGEITARTQQEIQAIERAIVENRQKTNSEISNDMYLTLTDQEEYVNPYTGKTEIGTNQWQNRWQNDLGEILYTNDPNYDPNVDPNLNLTGFRKSQVRPRYGG